MSNEVETAQIPSSSSSSSSVSSSAITSEPSVNAHKIDSANPINNGLEVDTQTHDSKELEKNDSQLKPPLESTKEQQATVNYPQEDRIEKETESESSLKQNSAGSVKETNPASPSGRQEGEKVVSSPNHMDHRDSSLTLLSLTSKGDVCTPHLGDSSEIKASVASPLNPGSKSVSRQELIVEEETEEDGREEPIFQEIGKMSGNTPADMPVTAASSAGTPGIHDQTKEEKDIPESNIDSILKETTVPPLTTGMAEPTLTTPAPPSKLHAQAPHSVETPPVEPPVTNHNATTLKVDLNIHSSTQSSTIKKKASPSPQVVGSPQLASTPSSGVDTHNRAMKTPLSSKPLPQNNQQPNVATPKSQSTNVRQSTASVTSSTVFSTLTPTAAALEVTFPGQTPGASSSASRASSANRNRVVRKFDYDSANQDPPADPLLDKQGEAINADPYCWHCHKAEVQFSCKKCPRSFHLKCLPSSAQSVHQAAKQRVKESTPYLPRLNWTCPECNTIFAAENLDRKAPTLKGLSKEQLNVLLKFAVQTIKESADLSLHVPVPEEQFPDYRDYILHPMDLGTIQDNSVKNYYGSIEAFMADVKWVVHNCTIYNSPSHPLTANAKYMFKVAKNETSEMEVCPDCFKNFYCPGDYGAGVNYFCIPCSRPHAIVWARLKGYPHWPAKVVRVDDQGANVDARFFGEHDRAWIPFDSCYLLSEEYPSGKVRGGKSKFDSAMAELNQHIKELSKVHPGKFSYAPFKTVFSKEHLYLGEAPTPPPKPQASVTLQTISVQQTNLKDLGRSADSSIDGSDDDKPLLIDDGSRGCETSRRISSSGTRSATFPSINKGSKSASASKAATKPSESSQNASQSSSPKKSKSASSSPRSGPNATPPSANQRGTQAHQSPSGKNGESKVAPTSMKAEKRRELFQQQSSNKKLRIANESLSSPPQNLGSSSPSVEASQSDTASKLGRRLSTDRRASADQGQSNLHEDKELKGTCSSDEVNSLREQVESLQRQLQESEERHAAETNDLIMTQKQTLEEQQRALLTEKEKTILDLKIRLEGEKICALEAQKKKHTEDVEGLKRKHEEAMDETIAKYEALMKEMKVKHDEYVKELVDDIKSKQWCAYCKNEANLFCCWNTSYCGYTCQHNHWPSHMKTCQQHQNQGNGGGGGGQYGH